MNHNRKLVLIIVYLDFSGLPLKLNKVFFASSFYMHKRADMHVRNVKRNHHKFLKGPCKFCLQAHPKQADVTIQLNTYTYIIDYIILPNNETATALT